MNALQRRNSFSFPTTFSELFENDFFSNKFSVNLPAVNIIENGTEFKVEVAAPGIKKDDFRITSEKSILNICAEHENSKEEKDESYTRREYNYTSFSRSFELPGNVKDDNIKAKYENGILKLSIPKKAEDTKNVKKKEITVQ